MVQDLALVFMKLIQYSCQPLLTSEELVDT